MMKYLKPLLIVAVLFILAIFLEVEQDPYSRIKTFSVYPVVETKAKTSLEDADDPCIWIHPDDPQLSAIICTDKDQGLAVYDLEGNEIQFLHLGRVNNVDIRSSFSFQNRKIDLIAASNQSTDTISLFTMDPQARKILPLPAKPIKPIMKRLYGLCMYKGRNDRFYVFITSNKGMVEQWEVYDDMEGQIGANLARTLKVSTQAEGCVADDELGFFYLAEEKKGIWKFNAEPDGGQIGNLISQINPVLMPDLEGLAIYYGRTPGTGYLIASCQGNNRFTVLDRANDHRCLALIEIADSHEIDGAQHSDGIDVSNRNLGDRFPEGIFVAQDGINRDGDPTNFKYVSMKDILLELEKLEK